MVTRTFSSPQRGSFLSTSNQFLKQKSYRVFVPSTGFFSIYCLKKKSRMNSKKFSSPQRGSFLSIDRLVTLKDVTEGFRPLNGVLFYLPASRSPLNLVVSRRVCGGNRIHLRNLSKKYIFSSKSFILWAAGQNIVLNWSVCHISHTHIIQFSLVFCTLTYVRCYFQANILCMFMRSI